MKPRIDWPRTIPFTLLHLVPFLAIMTGVRWFDVGLCVALYFGRMFFVTVGYHRYFAHRGFRLNRVMQFLLAFAAETSLQKGVLWWSGLHRHHHRYSDKPEDLHSPIGGFLWSHMGWVFAKGNFKTRPELIPDFTSYPELRFLNRFYLLPPVTLAVAVALLWGWPALITGFFLSTVLLFHGTYVINSLAHVIGRRRFATSDTSRNSLLLALITMGEGWHNNHHYYCASARQGFYWWEIDLSFYLLTVLNFFGLVSDLREPPAAVLTKNRIADGSFDLGLLQAKRERAMVALEKLKRRASHAARRRRLRLEAFLASTQHLVVPGFLPRGGVKNRFANT